MAPRKAPSDSTFSLLTEGYAFISNRCRRDHTRVFDTRLLLVPFTCLSGEQAARVFYDPARFVRRGAMPSRVQKTLTGRRGVQGLDGEAHRQRKHMFMALMTPQRVAQLADLFAGEWHVRSARWERMDRVVLLDELHDLLTVAVCAWADVPLPPADVRRRGADFAAMIDAPAALGPRHWRGRAARARAERWASALVREVRAGRLHARGDGGLHAVARHRDERGALLDERVAAVELLNVLRPTVAVARYIAFAALALHEHPHHRERLVNGDDAEVERFVQEVRRLTPFFPFAAARVRRTFDWQGHHFPRGRRVLLDLYGTSREPGVWADPDAFRPDRFRDWNGSPFNFIPQGGGDHGHGHRCAGEWITIALMKAAVRQLTRSLRYDVPPQDLRVKLTRFPAQPESRFVIRRVRRAPHFGG